MPKINVLPKFIAEKIAAGEVVEKPASVIKEIVENAIDAGATNITVEIKGGGILYMRVTDNGCGIKKEDVPTAFLRHATSKIVKEDDLESINTLGFRGEALAAISSVSKVEMLTKTEQDTVGTRYVIEGGEEKTFEETGCPDGTTVIVRDLFYNTPARMKFLHKDSSEANVVADLIEKIALSHPEIAFRFIKDGKTIISTSGDSKLDSVIYSVLGREFSKSLISAKGGNDTVQVDGFICKPIYCRPKRNAQYFFLNGRLIRSAAAISALEAGYKNSVMVGKFPACVLNLTINPQMVDVNVHPAKTEVRFSDDKSVFDAIYFTVKNALALFDERPQINVKPNQAFFAFDKINTNEFKQMVITQKEQQVEENEFYLPVKNRPESTVVFKSPNNLDFSCINDTTENQNDVSKKIDKCEIKIEPKITETEIVPQIKFIGEAFSTYIIVEKENSVYFIDKHASHERIIFERLKNEQSPESQQLLLPVTVKLTAEHYNAVINSTELLVKSGFEADDFGNNTIIIRAVPSSLKDEDVATLFYEVAANLCDSGAVEIEKLENIYHTVACKAAIKAGFKSSKEELIKLATEVLSRNDIYYCPHGRPVAFEIKKRDLEKQFGRIQ